MAILHHATLVPSKLELLSAWLPRRPWAADVTGLRQLGAYRFDDPAGQVGVEAFLLGTASGTVLHVPLTYRAAPLTGAEEDLVGIIEHSVLGRRWVYDGCADPVWALTAATAVLTGGTSAEEVFEVDGGPGEVRPPTATITGSGAPGSTVPPVGDGVRRHHDSDGLTIIPLDDAELVVVRTPGTELAAAHVLTGRWDGGGPAVLAGVRR